MHPYVIINCAMSVDGKIALPTRRQTKISSEEDFDRVHKLRSDCDAILVGVGTILSDDPKLTIKGKHVKNPIRIVLDSNCRTPMNAKVLSRDAKTIIVTSEECKKKLGNAEMLRCGKKRVDLNTLMPLLSKCGIKKLLVEGGETVIWSFLKERLADELSVYIGSMIIGGRNSPTLAGGEGVRSLKKVIPLKLIQVKLIGDGILLRYKVIK